MRIKFEYTTYESKLATFISMLQGGIPGWSFLYILFNIPAFIASGCEVDDPLPGILYGIGFVLSIAVFVLLLFVDTDKIDDFMTKNRKKDEYTLKFVSGLFNVVTPAKDFGQRTFTEFVIFALLKSRLVMNHVVAKYSISEAKKDEITSTFDALLHSFFIFWQSDNLIAPSDRGTLILNRMDTYEKILSSFSSSPFAMTYLGDMLFWFCEYGWIPTKNGIEPIADVDIMKILKSTADSRSFRKKYERTYDSIEMSLAQYLPKTLPKLAKKLKKDIAKSR